MLDEMHVTADSFAFIAGVEWNNVWHRGYFHGTNVVQILWLNHVELMDLRHGIFFRRGESIHLEASIGVIRIANADQQDCVRNAHQSLHVSNIDIRLGGTLVDGQSEYAPVEDILVVEEVEDCPTEADEFVLRSRIWFRHLQFNDQVRRWMRLHILDRRKLPEDNPVLLLGVFRIRLGIVDIY